jgi:hypothetical protein
VAVLPSNQSFKRTGKKRRPLNSSVSLQKGGSVDWYVYHSQKTMGHPYSDLGAPVVFSTKEQRKLSHGDTIWVIEGDLVAPTNFTIADCFTVKGTDTPSRWGDYARFKVKVLGNSSLLPGPVAVDAMAPWFAELHSRFITKQRFFCSLADHPRICSGLVAASGVAI